MGQFMMASDNSVTVLFSQSVGSKVTNKSAYFCLYYTLFHS